MEEVKIREVLGDFHMLVDLMVGFCSSKKEQIDKILNRQKLNSEDMKNINHIMERVEYTFILNHVTVVGMKNKVLKLFEENKDEGTTIT